MEDLQAFLDQRIGALGNCARAAGETPGWEKVAALLNDTVLQLKALRAQGTWDGVRACQVDFGTLRFPKKDPDERLAARIKAIREDCKEGLKAKLRAFSDDSRQVLSDLAETPRA